MRTDPRGQTGSFGNLRAAYTAGRKNYSPEIIEHFLSYFPKSFAMVLDVGCGTGIGTRDLAGENRHIIGLDPDPVMLEGALSTPTPGTSYIRASVQNIPFSDQYFNIVTSFAAFHWWWNVEGGLDEVRRVLKPSGYFIEVNKDDISTFLADLRGIISKITGVQLKDVKEGYDPVRILQNAGWKTEVKNMNTVEQFTHEQLWNRIRSMSSWNAVTPEYEKEVTDVIERYITPQLQHGIFKQPIAVRIVAAHM